MEELRLKAGNEELEVKGSPETIQQQSQAFYQHQKELEEMNVRAKTEFMEKLKNKMSVCAVRTASNTVPAIKRSTGKLEASWDEIQKALNAGEKFCVGDYKTETLKNGQPVTLVVTDVQEDFVRFESKDCVGNPVSWNEKDTNEGGFPTSNVKKYLDETIWAQLPEELKAVIGNAQRKWLDKDGNEAEYTCKLFLPAASEVFDEDDCYGDEGLYEQLEYYEDRRNRMKGSAEGSDTCAWWLASVRSGISTDACGVSADGYAGDWSASYGLRVPLCFLIKKEIS